MPWVNKELHGVARLFKKPSRRTYLQRIENRFSPRAARHLHMDSRLSIPDRLTTNLPAVSVYLHILPLLVGRIHIDAITIERLPAASSGECARRSVQRILVVCRSTSHCRKVVHTGISLAQKYSAKLFVLHVSHDPFSLEGWSPLTGTFHEEYLKLIEKNKNDLHKIVEKEKSQGIAITEFVREEKPLGEIMKVVESEKIDLMIMLAHEEGRIEHFLFGRTNEAILRKIPCSVLLVKQ
jgi:universal stress protein A